MKRLDVGLFFVCLMAGLFSCKKEQLVVEKDDSNAVMNVSIKTTGIQAKPFDMRYTSAGWMVFQEDQSPYLNRLDSQGNLTGQGNASVKGIDFYGEMLVEDEVGLFYRCTNPQNDPTNVVIQELDADYTFIRETEILDEQTNLRVTGFKYVGAGSFVFSVDDGNSSLPSKIYFYEGISMTLILLKESKRGILIDYVRSSKGYQYLAVESFFSGAPLSILILDKDGNLLRDVAAPDYVRTFLLHPQGKFLSGISTTTFIYSSKSFMSSMVFDDNTNQLIQGVSFFEKPGNNSNPTLLDFQFGQSGRIWVLSRDGNGTYTRELVLSQYANNGKKLWSRTLAGTDNLAGICRLRMVGNDQWQILASGSRYESTPLTLVNP